jgi:magnesium-transporting ATPase (P-type)
MNNKNLSVLDYLEASSRSVADILKDLSVEIDRGLTASEVEKRRQKYAWNRLEKTKRRSLWQIAIAQFNNPIAALLVLGAKATDNLDRPYEELTFIGIVGLFDPPRQDAKEAIKACQQADIRVIMLTGDRPITARQIGLAVGLTSDL